LDGVVATRAGWLARREVVEVTFDPKVLPYADLVRKAKAAGCTAPVFARSDAQLHTARTIVGEKAVRNGGEIRHEAKDTKFRLRKTPLRHVPMLEILAVRANAALGGRGAKGSPADRAAAVLAPSQRALLALVRKHPEAGWPDAVGRDFDAAWAEGRKVSRKLEGAKK
jgi:hypothetical protein